MVLQATNAYLKNLVGPGTEIPFEFVKEMPKAGSKLRLDLSSLLGTLFFTWVVLQLFPVRLFPYPKPRMEFEMFVLKRIA